MAPAILRAAGARYAAGLAVALRMTGVHRNGCDDVCYDQCRIGLRAINVAQRGFELGEPELKAELVEACRHDALAAEQQ